MKNSLPLTTLLSPDVVLHLIVRLPGNSFNKIARHLI